jgi:hypothetical protein
MTSSGSSVCNVRVGAREVVLWYLDHIDVFQSHAANVQHYLRGPIIAWTISILENHSGNELSSPPVEVDTEAKGGGIEVGSNWRNYLYSGESHQDFTLTIVEKKYEAMNPRTKARLDAFLEGVSLTVLSEAPNVPPVAAPQRQSSVDSTDLSLIEGLVGFRALSNSTSKLPMNVLSSLQKARRSNSITGSTKNAPRPRPQMDEAELITRLELYFRSLTYVVAQENDCVIALEPLKALKARTRLIVAAFVNTVGTVRNVRPVLLRLLTALTKELLAVSVLSEDIVRILRNIISNYVHATSFASLAFLSSPETSADQSLTPAILQYLLYLQKNWMTCENDCDIELMLSTVIDPQLRHLYKTAEFQSIGHLLEVYQTHRDKLHNIELPPRVDRQSDEEKMKQALKDIPREVISVNGSVLPRVLNRAELIQLLTSALNIRPLYEGRVRRRRGKAKSKTRNGLSVEIAEEISGNEADSDSLITGPSDTSDSEAPRNTNRTDDSRCLGRPRQSPTFRTATVDLLTHRLLVAASRSGTMGDAYFVVRDLFGGEDVEVVSSQAPSSAATLELMVRLASVTIRSHASFDVYPKSMVGDCEPLIQIHATTNETIALQELRKDDATLNANESSPGDAERILQERWTEKSGYRYLSIRPALYEKVSVWHTPS